MATRIDWLELDGRECLVITFDGHFTVVDAEAALARLSESIEDDDEDIVMVWDARRMEGFDREARQRWQVEMKALKPRLESVHLISTSPLVRIGACVVGAFMGFQTQAWNSLEELRV